MPRVDPLYDGVLELPFEPQEPPDPEKIQNYLQVVLQAAQILSKQTTTTVQNSSSTASSYPGQLAQSLLNACQLDILSSSTQDLPTIEVYQHPWDLKDDSWRLTPAYQQRRVDYLRGILRAMAPVAMDVAAHVVDLKDTDMIAIWILFSVWLPVAPHLSLLVHHLFVETETTFHVPHDPSQRMLLAEATLAMLKFYRHRGEIHLPMRWKIDWSRLSAWLAQEPLTDVRWYVARATAHTLQLAPAATTEFLEAWKVGVEDEQPVQIHPFDLNLEEADAQQLFLTGHARIWNHILLIPPTEHLRTVFPIHPLLVDLGPGWTFAKYSLQSSSVSRIMPTATTRRNQARFAAALSIEPQLPPILLIGPSGSGKSSLIRHVAHLLAQTSVLELHVDDDTDTKTLIGSYTATDIPGEFAWRPGALTRAVRDGSWVLLEDLEAVPVELQASLVPLFKERVLPLGNGKVERCHAHFRLFATCSSTRGILHTQYWEQVPIEPLPLTELKEVAHCLHPMLPEAIIDATLSLFRTVDGSGREEASSTPHRLLMGRSPSVRDLFKVLSRIEKTVVFERDATYTTEAQRTLCLAESVDVFAAACPDREEWLHFIVHIAAPAWGVTGGLAQQYMAFRKPTVLIHENSVIVGRTCIDLPMGRIVERDGSFAETAYNLRFMEVIGVCIRQNEPALLVGETGCGKTTLLQHMAKLAGRELVVQNLSLQTDSTDLLGGYRPIEMSQIARRVYEDFVDLFTSHFSRKQNTDFLRFTLVAYEKGNWKKLSQCFLRAAALGLNRIEELGRSSGESTLLTPYELWKAFEASARRFEEQRLACDNGLAFAFTEGALVEAIRKGKWVLLDEINLASSETLQRLTGLLDDANSSITLTERGDSEALIRHPDFRLFAAMNPATDAGKKDLKPSVRSRFTEVFVPELLDPVELRVVASKYISDVLPSGSRPPEHTDEVISAVDIYLRCRQLAEERLVDGGGQKPRYTLRTLTRALSAARNLIHYQRLGIRPALYEGFELAFAGSLDSSSVGLVHGVVSSVLGRVDKQELEHPGRRPGGRSDAENFVLLKPFWIKRGPLETIDWSEDNDSGRPKFVLTKTARDNLRRLTRTICCGPWPVLLEGPTSAGKTTLVEYVAARCGHNVVRINNHEHTDIQEYTGGFTADSQGSLSFRDGLLVKALKLGHWVILDELNLAPTEVLEALNRLLDDNRELFLPEINEIVKPHENFRLFATQNPSGAYGGRKPLSRAFRNRFVEIHIGDIPSEEMVMILEKRCSCPPSHARILVSTMEALQQQRSKSSLFMGKNGYITPRDLLRWAGRRASTRQELADEGYMLLAERLRTVEEKLTVKEVLERQIKVTINEERLYYEATSESNMFLESLFQKESLTQEFLGSVALTSNLRRLMTLVLRCSRQREPVLLVGETGNGKTTAIQLLSILRGANLHIVNCHATTETSDLIGGLRPVRGRSALVLRVIQCVRRLLAYLPDGFDSLQIPDYIQGFARDSDYELEQLGSDPEVECLNLGLPDNAISELMELTKALRVYLLEGSGRVMKRRKKGTESEILSPQADEVKVLLDITQEIEALYQKYNALFEWNDGPLVSAMKQGDLILLDEMSLAEDAVLERLNSVLEPSRTLILAENATADEEDSRVVEASHDFELFATMNPGGDFGKRELSPALRSRFTEIWVPQVVDLQDISLILDRSLSACCLGEFSRNDLKDCFLEYIEWFNGFICNGISNLYPELALSLRDIQTWSSFVVTTRNENDDISLWEAYLHGAYLMHLDGLGLGSSLSPDDAKALRRQATEFLIKQISSNVNACIDPERPGKITVVRNKFGIQPFWIAQGPHTVDKGVYNLQAPTTALNCMRVLRGMQLKKPILLEGSPGVGKTSLITALAAASGYKLIRINLSEQTDIADLIGSDLPAPQVEQNGSSKANFRWSDGVLLSAIKTGHWVLLDELNLASQTVLEGLNSCLDHRASLFVPELGRTFSCPPTFRIFAAQNPMSEGGNRKGLPKSFLNRFTKVYVDAFTPEDMKSIIQVTYPRLDSPMVEKMIHFNTSMQAEVAEKKLFGHAGSPWEFNLRDMFRWCELLCHFSAPGINKESSVRLVRDLYVQRFRTGIDRLETVQRYGACFDSTPFQVRRDSNFFTCTRGHLKIGDVTIDRSAESKKELIKPGESYFMIPLSLLEPFEAVARCVVMGWPVLIAGGPLSGKNSLVKSLSGLSNSGMVEISLSPSSDVSELIGCFEQVDCVERYFAAIDDVIEFSVGYLQKGKNFLVEEISYRLFRLLNDARREDYELKSILNDASLLTDDLLNAIASIDASIVDSKTLRDLKRIFNEGRNFSKSQGGHFEWKDGPLVQAMTQGHWLHLRNVNLCPSSVLDRLNSVMEPNGVLLLAECIANDDFSTSSGHRSVTCHPNFRIFLSMDPARGEISRAMRNRCVEIALVDQDDGNSSRALLDRMADAWKFGMRITTFGDRFQEISTSLRQESLLWYADSRLIAQYCSRGKKIHHNHCISEREPTHHSWCAPLLPCPSVEWDWSTDPKRSRFVWESRHLFSFFMKYDSLGAQSIPMSLLESKGGAEDVDDEMVRNHGILLYLARQPVDGLDDMSAFLGGTQSTLGRSLSFMAREYRLILDHFPAEFAKRLRRRLPQILLEQVAIECYNSLPAEIAESIVSRSTLEVSYRLAYGLVDRSLVTCVVTPSLYPFFEVLDQWLKGKSGLVQNSIDRGGTDLLRLFDAIFRERDKLWNLLQREPYLPDAHPLFAFDESCFTVQWHSLGKPLRQLMESPLTEEESHPESGRKLRTIFDAIERAVHCYGRNEQVPSILKYVSHPVVPQTGEGWHLLHELKVMANLFTLPMSSEDPIIATDLAATEHPLLFLDASFKLDVLNYLCTVKARLAQSLNDAFPADDLSDFVDHMKMRKERSHRLFRERIESLRIPDVERAEATPEKALYLYMSFGEDLLLKFAHIQISAVAQLWCERAEAQLLRKLCDVMIFRREEVSSEDVLSDMCLILQKFIDFAMQFSLWNVDDIVVFKTILWAIQAKPSLDAFDSLIEGLICEALCKATSRFWLGSSHVYRNISLQLELPSAIDFSSVSDGNIPVMYDRITSTTDVALLTTTSLVPGNLDRHQIQNHGVHYLTIENYGARKVQAKQLMTYFALLDDEQNDPSTLRSQILYLFLETVDGLRHLIPNLPHVTLTKGDAETSLDQLKEHLTFVSHSYSQTGYKKLLDKAIIPLVTAISRIWDYHDHKDLYVALLYLGLVRFHLLLPDSPVDPGKKPRAKAFMLELYLKSLRSELVARRTESIAMNGSFDNRDQAIQNLTSEIKITEDRQNRLEERIIDRPKDSSPFVEFYRDIHDAAARFFDIDNVSRIYNQAMTNSVKNESESMDYILHNFEKTAEAFVERLRTTYFFYEDITIPVINSVGMLSKGLHMVVESSRPKSKLSSFLSQALLDSSTFPFEIYGDQKNALEDETIATPSNPRSLGLMKRMLLLSHLFRRHLKVKVLGLSSLDILKWRFMTDGIVGKEAKLQIDESSKNDVELEERHFRQQFPDHRRDFALLLQDQEDNVEDNNIFPVGDKVAEKELPYLNQQECDTLFNMHNEYFNPQECDPTEEDRLNCFAYGYRATSFIIKTFKEKLPIDLFSDKGYPHMALAVGLEYKEIFDTKRPTSVIERFHTYPYPQEALQASAPLAGLADKIGDLTRAFPDNSILLALWKVVDKVRKLNISAVPLGKFMTGLEVILRQAQDWEQHASRRFCLGTPLDEVSHLVSKWRQLELQSWAFLLREREEKYAANARKMWPHLHSILSINELSLNPTNLETAELLYAPRWIMKGLPEQARELLVELSETDESVLNIFKVLDTFILTSSLGEFPTRMNMLTSFSNQLSQEVSTSTNKQLAVTFSCILGSLVKYYRQFEGMLSQYLAEARLPFEKRLKEEVKLAKWDNQTYYALTESTEKNHRKLMRILREYDDALDATIGGILMIELCRGVREDSDSDSPKNSIPAKLVFFPPIDSYLKESTQLVRKQLPFDECQWASKNAFTGLFDNHVLKMRTYAKRIESMILSERIMRSAMLGAEESVALSETIFARIETLRSKNNNRPMKERALVDLLRELKRHGMGSTKWSTPLQIRNIGELFKIPSILNYASSGLLESSETYFFRTTAETNKLYAEVSVMGSKYLTKRQLDMIESLSASSHFMLSQQRCLIASVSSDLQQLRDCVYSLPESQVSLPTKQDSLSSEIMSFYLEAKLAKESLGQLIFYINSCLHVIDSVEFMNWSRGFIAELECTLNSFPNCYPKDRKLIDLADLSCVENLHSVLQKAESLVRSAREHCKLMDVLPCCAFDNTLEKLKSAIHYGVNIDTPTLDHRWTCKIDHFLEAVSSAIQALLLAVQGVYHTGEISQDDESHKELLECHYEAAKRWGYARLNRLKERLGDVVTLFSEIHCSQSVTRTELDYCTATACDLRKLFMRGLYVMDTCWTNYLSFHREFGKLQYILVRVFRVLIAQGFCSDEIKQDREGDEDGKGSGLGFEDEQDGTGMGEGDGKIDVTDQIENEEQLLGLKNDIKDEDKDDKRMSKQLENEEADKGMEMEADFNGEMFDLPEKSPDDQGLDENDDEEIERELGEGGGPNEEVIDEKLWNDDDDNDNDNEKEEEKFEQNSSIKGMPNSDEIGTKGDTDNKESIGNDHNAERENLEAEDTGGDESPEINEDIEENREEHHGVNVRDERDHNTETGNQMELDDDLNIDDNSENDSKQHGDPDIEDEIRSTNGEDSIEAEPEPETQPAKDSDEEQQAQDEAQQQLSASVEPTELEDHPSGEEPEESASTDNRMHVDDPQDHVEPGLGVRASDGRDAVQDDGSKDEEMGRESRDITNAGDSSGTAPNDAGDQSGQSSGTRNGSNQSDKQDLHSKSEPSSEAKDVPNPFKNLGDASKFWHRRLSMVKDTSDSIDGPSNNDDNIEGNQQDEYEYVDENQWSTTQALGEVEDFETMDIDMKDALDAKETETKETKREKENPDEINHKNAEIRRNSRNGLAGNSAIDMDDNEEDGDDEIEVNADEINDSAKEDESENSKPNTEYAEKEEKMGNVVVSDLSRLHVQDTSMDRGNEDIIVEETQATGISSAEFIEARHRWLIIQSTTQTLSRRLCEKLRLIMEPLVASKLRGDYRTGKRINMKRVIGYIASGYRKDKIWLRRTKPAKRNYRVLVAVDDSESMLKTGAGDMALKAMATLATGMSQLEIGEIGIARFGDKMDLVHPFHTPFTSESGANIVHNFQFAQQRTRTALCVESAMHALEAPGDVASLQLVFLISDGRIERDSRATLRRLIREMMERNILLAMIIVEGNEKKKDSIVNMKEVSFENGKPKVKRFMDDYPFPYYIVLEDMHALPEVLGDALRQWFEMLARLQGSN